MKQLFSKSFIINSSFYQIDEDLTNNFIELIRLSNLLEEVSV